jgi:hypothetical protein
MMARDFYNEAEEAGKNGFNKGAGGRGSVVLSVPRGLLRVMMDGHAGGPGPAFHPRDRPNNADARVPMYRIHQYVGP